MHSIFRRLKGGQKGITGLETAIILIAFVIVASVFSYVVLTSGLFASQKAKVAIQSGLEETGSTIELKGNILGRMAGGVLTTVYFTVGIPPGGNSVDFTPSTAEATSLVVISYSDAYQIIPTVNWTLTKLNTSATDNMLEGNRLFLITVDLTAASTNVTEDQKLKAYHKFSLEVKPPVGAIVNIERTIPNKINDVVNLY